MYKSVLLFGPPCAGKGTAGRKLAQMISQFRYMATGDMVRDILAGKVSSAHEEKSGLAKIILDHISVGELIPDEAICSVFREYVQSCVEQGFYRPVDHLLLIDGIPRTVEQAKSLSDVVDVVEIYHFTNVSNFVLMDRMKSRVLEDIAKGRSPRDDDTPEAMKVRLGNYPVFTLPTLRFYASKTKIFGVDASRSKKGVLGQVYTRAMNHTLKVL